MIRYEEAEFVKELLENESCILVPMEIGQDQEGALSILAYPTCRQTAEIFEERFSSDPFGKEAALYLKEALTPIMNSLGYDTEGAAGHRHFEYRCREVNREAILPDCCLIDTLEGEENEALDLEGFVLDPADPMDRMAVIRRDNKIVCYAGLNDLCEEDGLLELTVECEAPYRRRGYAASCVAHLTDYLKGLGHEVKYVTSVENKASQKTAEKAGFRLHRTTLSFVCLQREEEETEE